MIKLGREEMPQLTTVSHPSRVEAIASNNSQLFFSQGQRFFSVLRTK